MTEPKIIRAWIDRFDADGKVAEHIEIAVADVGSVPDQPEKYTMDDVYNLVVEDENGVRFRPYRFCEPFPDIRFGTDEDGNRVAYM